MNLLAIGFYVRGGMMLLFGCFFMLYVGMLFAFSMIPESSWNQPTTHIAANATANSTPAPLAAKPVPPPVAIFRVMAGIMSGMVVLAWIAGALTLYSGNCIKKRKHRVLVYVMAGLNCFFIPYGTLLGVFTFIVLGSPEAIAEWNDPSL
jgi:hypothetical protein